MPAGDVEAISIVFLTIYSFGSLMIGFVSLLSVTITGFLNSGVAVVKTPWFAQITVPLAEKTDPYLYFARQKETCR